MYSNHREIWTDMSNITKNSLEGLLEQLIIKQQHLDGVINWLKNLEIRCSIPGMKAEEIGWTVDDRGLHIWKKYPLPAAEEQMHLIGRCARIRTIADIAQRMADRDENVVVHGETGVGKNFLATYIHNSGKRKGKPFIRVPAQLLVNLEEINRHIRQADHGTLYISNLEDLDRKAQSILRQEISGSASNRSCRLITSSRVDLDMLVSEGGLNPALKDLLSQCYITLPALKDRSTDIPEFAAYYLPRLCIKNTKQPKAMSPEYLTALKLYDWPGNIRELINTLEQSIYVAGDKPTLFSKDLPIKIRIETSLKAAQAKRGL